MRPMQLCVLGAIGLALTGSAQAQKYGGVLKSLTMENPPSLSIHEENTVATNWPMLPVYSNLVFYNPEKTIESGDDVVGELAESWEWSDGNKRLTFKLRRGVTWHDGRPFTSADVKQTYDVVRGASEKHLKLNPRKAWYENVTAIEVHGDYEVAFVLKRPQPALMAILATGYSPVYPAHLDPQEMRVKAIGTGPFRLKELLPDQKIVLEKNPNFYIKGRPYLDGIEYYVIKSRPTRYAALHSGQVDVFNPLDGTPQFRDSTKALYPQMVVHEVLLSAYDNVLLNAKKPPFDNSKVRAAVNYALDRSSMIRTVAASGAVPGGTVMPPPFGTWGLPPGEVAKLPGYGDPAKDKAEARRLLGEAGYGPNNPLRVTVSTRNLDLYTDMAVWMVGELKSVGIDASLETVETATWFARLARRDFTIAANLTGTPAADPDANFYENYACGSQRNYSNYCNPELEALMDKASQESDHVKRLALTWEIDRRLQLDGARPILAFRLNYFMHWPYVKGLVPKNTVFNYSRMTDVWLDK
jgi:peptide/nickel transport system substrate-binding protein